MNTAFASLIEDEWKRTPAQPGRLSPEPSGLFWTYAVTPPFPAQWPPNGDRRVCGYLYAMSQDPGITDGIRVAAPWGRLEYIGGGQGLPRFLRLSDTVREIGIQGVRPVTKEEMSLYEQGGRAVSVLESLTGQPDRDDPGTLVLRDYYRTWCGHNGVIIRELFRMHEPFFRWIGGN